MRMSSFSFLLWGITSRDQRERERERERKELYVLEESKNGIVIVKHFPSFFCYVHYQQKDSNRQKRNSSFD